MTSNFNAFLRIAFFCFFSLQFAAAQTLTGSDAFEGDNLMLLTVRGNGVNYRFSTRNLDLRMNEQTHQLQLRVPFDSFIPDNDSSPVVLLHQIFRKENYPFFSAVFEVPLDLLSDEGLQNDRTSLQGRVFVFESNRDAQARIHVQRQEQQDGVAVEFSFNLRGPGSSIDPVYDRMITGVIDVSVPKARWQLRQQNSR